LSGEDENKSQCSNCRVTKTKEKEIRKKAENALANVFGL